MLYGKFIQLVEDHAEELTKAWIDEVKQNPATPGYNKMPDDLLAKRIGDVYKRLHVWILQNDPADLESGEHYIKLGRERASEEINLSEVIYSIIISRAVLSRFVHNQGIINSTFDVQQAFEFFNKVNNFYDKVNYLVTLGYESYKSKDKEAFKKTEFIERSVNSITKWLIK